MKKYVIRLKTKELMKAQIDKDISSDAKLAELMNVNVTQIWRAKLPVSDKRHNTPGNQFIAGVMQFFGGKFDDFFYIEEIVDQKKANKPGEQKNAV
ncbi:hypothetical protein ABNC96_06655 [Paenibacillus larvae]